MTLEIPPALERRIKSEASKAGVDAARYARELIERGLLAPDEAPPAAPPDTATLDLLEEWRREDQTDDPAELERRAAEFAEFAEALNRNRRDTEGPSARIPFP